MKAIVFHRHGGVDELRFEDLPRPAVGPEDILVKVNAVSLNGFDPMVLRGIPGLKTPLPMIPGADIAGEIAELGSAVDKGQWRTGQRVTIVPNQKRIGMMGETLRGGCCEFVSVNQAYVLPIPDTVGDVDAACLPTAYGAALRMMVTRGQVSSGEKVLILGASGGVGTCCVQLAKIAGAEVIACTSSADKAERLREIGADHVIDTSKQDYVAEVIARYGKPRTFGGGGVDVIVNYTGGDTWAQCFRALRAQGRILTCGATAGYEPKTDLRYIWSFEFTIIGSNGWTVQDQIDLLDMVASKRLKPVVHSVRPLAEYKAALTDLMERRVFGKAVVEP
jgi:alcohol dehydrogenase